MGLAAKGTKILPACGMSWHWRIEKQTHYEGEREKERGRGKNPLRLNANSLKSNSGARKTLSVSNERVKFTSLSNSLNMSRSFFSSCFSLT